MPLLRAELTAALGMSELDAGFDLASLRARAELDGDHFVVNGRRCGLPAHTTPTWC